MTQSTTNASYDELAESITTPLRTRRRYHAGLIFLAALCVLIVVGVIGAFHLQPLRNFKNQIVSSRVLDAHGALAHETHAASMATWLEPKGTFTVLVVLSLYDDGGFPVTIDRVWGPPSIRHQSHQTYFEPNIFGANSEGFTLGQRFIPFTLGAHSEVTLIDRWTQRCVASSPQQRYLTVRNLPVSSRILEIHHLVYFPIHSFRIELRSTC